MRRILLFISWALLLAAAASAQQMGGTIKGRTTDAETQEGLIGANVVIHGTTLGASSDADGNFIVLNVPPGSYVLRFRTRFDQREMLEVQVRPNNVECSCNCSV